LVALVITHAFRAAMNLMFRNFGALMVCQT